MADNLEQRAQLALLNARDDLMALQAKGANRDRAVAITHLETALLWLNKDLVFNAVESDRP